MKNNGKRQREKTTKGNAKKIGEQNNEKENRERTNKQMKTNNIF